MKTKLTLILSACLLGASLISSPVQAAGATSDKKELTAEMKTGKRVSIKKTWAAAQKEAKEKNLLVLVVFTDTQYCPGCKRLEKELFSKPDFKNNAGAYCVMLEYSGVATKNKNNKDMLDSRAKFSCQGLPGVCLVDAEGNKVAGIGYGSQPFYMLQYLKRHYDSTITAKK